MKKTNSNVHTLIGINNTIAILKCSLFSIINIDLMLNSKAEKNDELQKLIKNKNVNEIKKNQFFQKYPEGRTQGIGITFSGNIVRQKIPNFTKEKNVCILVLDQIEDPQNFGQIIRTAECGGVDGIVFPRHHSVSITDTVLQVSQGAFTNMPLYEVTNLRNEFKKLKDSDFWIVGVENSIDAKSWYDIEYSGRIVIVLGSEGKGIRKMVLEECDFHATIPMQGEVNSLNVSAAASAILFERIRQLNGK